VREISNEDEAWKPTKLRSSKYLNNLIEQNHRGIKSRTRPMLGFKNFDYAAITIAGVELAPPYFAEVNLPCIAYVSKTKLRLRSGMQSLLHKPLPLQSPLPAYLNICTRADGGVFPVVGVTPPEFNFPPAWPHGFLARWIRQLPVVRLTTGELSAVFVRASPSPRRANLSAIRRNT
jgi:DDE domain